MYLVTREFSDTVRRSHKVAIEARVHTPAGETTELEIVEGTVTLDASASVRGRCDLTLAGAEWVPRGPGDRLAPYGAEIEIRRGVHLPNGSTETVPLGWFGIEDLEITDDGLQTRVSGFDRSRRVQYALIEDDVQIPASTPFVDAILILGRGAWPNLPVREGFGEGINFAIGAPLNAFAGDDRWQAMRDLAFSAGQVLFFDGNGLLTLRPYSERSVALEVSEGPEGVLIEVARQWSRTSSFNRVIARSGSPDGDSFYKAVATDDNPGSPTYYGGPFGQIPTFYDVPAIAEDSVNDVVIRDVAASVLARSLGSAQSISFGMIANPALEPEDTIRITRKRLGVNEDHVVETLTIGLGADAAMTGTTRQVNRF